MAARTGSGIVNRPSPTTAALKRMDATLASAATQHPGCRGVGGMLGNLMMPKLTAMARGKMHVIPHKNGLQWTIARYHVING